ncbi:MAG: hypothetical protein MZW92_80200 [Comamonadaceae bacterium]|nr:hypothetical protein [Comamonadaceae bacterium]
MVYNARAHRALRARPRTGARCACSASRSARSPSLLLGEQALLTLAAIPLGFLIGFGICAAVAAAINATQETFRMPLVLIDRTPSPSPSLVVAAAARAVGHDGVGRLRPARPGGGAQDTGIGHEARPGNACSSGRDRGRADRRCVVLALSPRSGEGGSRCR